MKTYFSYPSTYVFCFNLCLCWMYYEQKSKNVILKDNNITNKYFELTCPLLSELQKRNKRIHKLIEKMTQVCTKFSKKCHMLKRFKNLNLKWKLKIWKYYLRYDYRIMWSIRLFQSQRKYNIRCKYFLTCPDPRGQ